MVEQQQQQQQRSRGATESAAPAATTADPTIIDGKAIARQVRAEVASEVAALQASVGKVPGLAVVIVGTRKDSQTYVRNKHKACLEAGIHSFVTELPESVSQEELARTVRDLNARSDVHGILVQLPLPAHIDSDAVLHEIALEKDVDGFHPLNIGKLCMHGRDPPLFVPCTPRGIVELLERSGVQLRGKNAVVLGRSNIVGLPVAMLLVQRDATVTICHSKTRDLEAKVRDADVLVAAIGRPHLVPGEWIKRGAAVIDVGINSVEDSSAKRGYRLVGDVHFESAKAAAAHITPVPGGVGPMTIAMLLVNTLQAAKRAFGVRV